MKVEDSLPFGEVVAPKLFGRNSSALYINERLKKYELLSPKTRSHSIALKELIECIIILKQLEKEKCIYIVPHMEDDSIETCYYQDKKKWEKDYCSENMVLGKGLMLYRDQEADCVKLQQKK